MCLSKKVLQNYTFILTYTNFFLKVLSLGLPQWDFFLIFAFWKIVRKGTLCDSNSINYTEMNKKPITLIVVIAVVAVAFLWGVGINNKLVNAEENVSGSWANVENAYKRRADLIPQLVATVQGAANYEKGTLTEVIEARSKATSVQVDANDLSEANVAQFQKAQDALSGALTRYMNIVVERYPELTATKGFQDLQVQLEGTENRIATERTKFNDEVKAYNKALRRFPNNIIAGICGFEKKGYFTAPEGSDQPVDVNFDF